MMKMTEKLCDFVAFGCMIFGLGLIVHGSYGLGYDSGYIRGAYEERRKMKKDKK